LPFYLIACLQGMSSTRYVACGRDRDHLTILEISHRLHHEEDGRVEKMTLLEIDSMDRNPFQSTATDGAEMMEILNLTYQSGADKKFKLKICISDDDDDVSSEEDDENSNGDIVREIIFITHDFETQSHPHSPDKL